MVRDSHVAGRQQAVLQRRRVSAVKQVLVMEELKDGDRPLGDVLALRGLQVPAAAAGPRLTMDSSKHTDTHARMHQAHTPTLSTVSQQHTTTTPNDQPTAWNVASEDCLPALFSPGNT